MENCFIRSKLDFTLASGCSDWLGAVRVDSYGRKAICTGLFESGCESLASADKHEYRGTEIVSESGIIGQCLQDVGFGKLPGAAVMINGNSTVAGLRHKSAKLAEGKKAVRSFGAVQAGVWIE